MDSGIESTECSNGSITENPALSPGLEDNINKFEINRPMLSSCHLASSGKHQEIRESCKVSKEDEIHSGLLSDDCKDFSEHNNSSSPELLPKVNNIQRDQGHSRAYQSHSRGYQSLQRHLNSNKYFSTSHKLFDTTVPKQNEMNFNKDYVKKVYGNKSFNFSSKKINNFEVGLEKPLSEKSEDAASIPVVWKLKINFPNHDPLSLNIRPSKSFTPNPLGEVNAAEEVAADNYYGPLAVLPYECRELQRKFKHYRHRLKQMKDLTNGKPKEKKLRTAAALNNTDLVKSLISEGVNPNCIDSRRRTPLHIAASKGYTDVVRALLQHGANPNQKDIIGNTALHLAACTSHIETVTLLLNAGTDAQEPDNSGFSPLHLANSRLRLMQKDINPSSTELREQVLKIIDMMEAFMKSSGNTEDAETLASLTTKLSLTDTSCQGEDEFKSLLSSLQDLTLSKAKVD